MKILPIIVILSIFSSKVLAEKVTLDVSTASAGFQEVEVEYQGTKGLDLMEAAKAAVEGKFNGDANNYLVDITLKTDQGFIPVTSTTDLSKYTLSGTGSLKLNHTETGENAFVDQLPAK